MATAGTSAHHARLTMSAFTSVHVRCVRLALNRCRALVFSLSTLDTRRYGVAEHSGAAAVAVASAPQQRSATATTSARATATSPAI
eukprot:2153345-Alexandrium_andersonii.AAC.1